MTDTAGTTTTSTLTYSRYPAYKDSGVDWLGEIPAHWEVARLKWISKRFAGGTPDKSNLRFWEDGTIPWIASGEVNQGVIGTPTTYITELGFKNSSARWIPKNSLVVALAGQGKTKGMVAYLKIDTTGNQSLAAVIPNEERLFSKYAYAYLQASYKQLRGVAGEGERDGLNLQSLGSLSICVPPLAEQTRIAEFLDRKTVQIDQAIAQKEQLIELLNERRQVMIYRAVTRGLNPDAPMRDSGIDWIGEIPEHWSICALGYAAKISTGATPDRSRPGYWNGNIPWVKTGEINYSLITATEECISRSGLKNSSTRLSPIGTILMAMYGQGVTRGRVGILGVSAAYNQACAAIQVGERLFNQYAYYFFVSAYPFIRDAGNETSQMNLSSGYIAKVKITIPVKEEQIEIVAYCKKKESEFEEVIRLQTKTIQKLQELKSTLINSAVTGKIKV